MLVKENFPLTDYNTFHIKVLAEEFIEVFSEEELSQALIQLRGKEFFVLGGGSNILLTSNIRTVVKISVPGIKITDEDENYAYLSAGAGVIWNELVTYSLDRNFGGIENLVLIPGTVGAAPIQNIGAYGQELKDSFHSLNAVEIHSGAVKTFDNRSCAFGYRTSVFKSALKNKFIISSVTVKLNKNPRPNLEYAPVKAAAGKEGLTSISIADVSRIIAGIRRSKLPDPAVTGNAGSFFKNPEIGSGQFEKLKTSYPAITGFRSADDKVKISAGWLIEQCGWKGKRVGDTGIHDRQALVIVNYGNASGSDILGLAEKIKKSVFDKFEISLEAEVNII